MITPPDHHGRKINDAEWMQHGLVKYADDKPGKLEYTPLGFYVIELICKEIDNRDKEWILAINAEECRLKKRPDERNQDVFDNESEHCTKNGNEKGREQRKLILPALIGGIVGSLFYFLIKFLFFGI